MAGRVEGHSLLDSLRCNFFLFFFFFCSPTAYFCYPEPPDLLPRFFFCISECQIYYTERHFFLFYDSESKYVFYCSTVKLNSKNATLQDTSVSTALSIYLLRMHHLRVSHHQDAIQFPTSFWEAVNISDMIGPSVPAPAK